MMLELQSLNKSHGQTAKAYQNATDDVAEMGHVVYVGQGAGDQDVVLPRDGEQRLGRT